MRPALVALILICVAGCATQNRFVGQSVNQALLEFGEPSQIIALEPGKRGYQWETVVRETKPQITYGVTIGDGPVRASTVFGAGKDIVTRETTCLRTAIASRQGEAWIIDEMRVRGGC